MAAKEVVYQKPRQHQWRWNKLVGPLVPKDGAGRTFLDLGCNAGFYMVKANKLGYKTIGIERDPAYIKQAPKELDITECDINYYEPHAAYLTNLTCVHYHQSEEQLEALLLKLMYSTENLLIMGRHKVESRIPADREYIARKLKGWHFIAERTSPIFYTILVESPFVVELNIEEAYQATRKFTLNLDGFLDFVPAFEQFVRKIINKEPYDPKKLALMDYFRARKLRYPLGRLWEYERMIEEIKKSGLKVPLLYSAKEDRIKDGYHRLIILRELGEKRFICRIK